MTAGASGAASVAASREEPRMPRVLYWLAFGTFAVATDSFLIAGLLPGIGTEYAITIAVAGNLLTVFAITYAAAAPAMATLLGRWDRRHVLMLSLGVFVAGSIAAALSPDYVTLLAVRALTACFTCLYSPTAAALGASLVPAAQRGRALSLVAMGLTVGPAIGVPLGTFIGDAFGWRIAFAVDAAIGLAAFIAIAYGVPRGHRPPPVPLAQRLAPLGQGAVVRALLVTVAWVGGSYTFYTYLSGYLAPLGISGAGFAVVLMIFGGGAFVGNLIGGRASDRLGPQRVLGFGLATLVATLAALGVAPSLPFAAATALVLITLWSVVGFMVFPARQSQLIGLAPAAAPLLLALNASAMYLGIAIGAALGSVTLAHGGPASLGWAGAAVEFVALMLLWSERRATAASAQSVPAE